MIDLDKEVIPITVHQDIPFDFLEKHSLMFYKESDSDIEIISYKENNDTFYNLINFTSKNIIFHLASKSQIDKYLFRIRNFIDIHYISIAPYISNENIANALEIIIQNAISNRASDIHLEYKKNSISLIRYRINSDLHKIITFKKDFFQSLLSIIKLKSKMDISSSTKPQDGRFSMNIYNEKYDFRISCIPLYNGESMVVRILHSKNKFITFENLNLPKHSQQLLKKTSSASSGLMLFTGPTGSGKTTSLYAVLNEQISSSKKIITIEDPIEYELKGSEQIEISKNDKISFDNILKSVFRHDPDIIMIGEIRDKSSLDIVLESSLSGHLVLSTLHTKDAIRTIMRLKEMEVEDYLIRDAISCIHASRLVQTLCPHCKIIDNINEDLKNKFNLQNITIYKKGSCSKCYMTGYDSRISICETLEISQIIKNDKIDINAKILYKIAKENNFTTMLEHGLEQVKKGIINLEDLLNQVYFDYES